MTITLSADFEINASVGEGGDVCFQIELIGVSMSHYMLSLDWEKHHPPICKVCSTCKTS